MTGPIQPLIRSAVAGDARAIRGLIFRVKINPASLDWRRFVVATDGQDKLLGCGQIKPHRDGSYELASIAVQPGFQRQGLGTAIIRRLLEYSPPLLYLICRASLGEYYEKFGFETVPPAQMPPYFQRIDRLVRITKRILPKRWVGLLIMRRTA